MRPLRLIDSNRNIIVVGTDLLCMDDRYKVKSIDWNGTDYDICCSHESNKADIHITGKASGIYQVVPEVRVI